MAKLIEATARFRRPAIKLRRSVAPDRRLISQSRILSWVVLAALLVSLVIDVAEISALALRAGSISGIMNGGFAFVLDFPPFSPSTESIPAAFIPVSQLPMWQSAMAALLLTLRLLPGAVILSSLYALLRLYADGLIFTSKNTVQIRRIGWALLAFAAVPLLTHASLFAAGLSPVVVKLEERQLHAAVAGIIVFVVAHVMAFGDEIERDRAGFI